MTLSNYASQLGRKGGLASTAKLTPEQRTERARGAAKAMHAKRRAKFCKTCNKLECACQS